MQLEGIQLKFLVNASKNVLSFFSSLFFSFLLIISDRVGRKYLCKQDTQIRVLQIMQNNISNLKSLIINYITILINFLDLLCWFKHAFIWKLQRNEFSSKICKFVFCNLCSIVQFTQNHRLYNHLNLFWRVFLMIKSSFYVKIAKNLVFRHSLLIVFFVDMFFKFCKLQNMIWPK